MSERERCLRSIVFSITLLVCFAATLAASPAAAEEKRKLTLEDLLDSSKFFKSRPTQIMWLPDGQSFLYFYKEGMHNYLWRFDTESIEKEKIAEWNEIQKSLREKQGERKHSVMDEVNATGNFPRAALTVSPGGGSLLGSLNGDLYIFDIKSGKAKFLATGGTGEIFATFSPDGKKIAFVRDGDLYVLDMASAEVKRLTERPGDHILNGVADWVYEEELDLQRSFWWSPDSQRIAYLQFDTSPIETFPIVDHLSSPVAELEQQRYPKAGGPNSIVHLGIIDVSVGGTTWIDIGEDKDIYIPCFNWLPSGRELWYQWLNRDQTRLELRFADPASGQYRTVVVDEDPAWVVHNKDVLFTDEERFLWISERDGWRHLYLYRTDGTLINQLTRGKWEVLDVNGLNKEKKAILFQASEKSPLERHIYRVNLNGTEFKRLSSEEGIHFASMSATGSYYLDTWSNPSTPTRIDICNFEGEKLLNLHDSRLPVMAEYEPATPEFFTVTAEDGTILNALMIKPPHFDPEKKYPVLVYVYGGPHSGSTVRKSWDAWSGRSLFLKILVHQGIIIFSIDNRGTRTRGRDWNRLVHRRLGYWELRDNVEGVRYLKTLPYIDDERMGIFGGSYGGYMVLLALFKAPEHFNVGISLSPVSDWRFYDTIFAERYMDMPQDNPDGYRESAPLNFAENLESKLLLACGMMDNNVHMQNTIQLAEGLMKAGKFFSLMPYPRERHSPVALHHQMHRFRLMYEFIMSELSCGK